MARGSLKGAHAKETSKRLLERGGNIVAHAPTSFGSIIVDFQQYISCDLIYLNRHILYKEYIQSAAKSTQTSAKKVFRYISSWLDEYTAKTGLKVQSADDVDNRLITYMHFKLQREEGRSAKVKIFNRFMRTIGVEKSLVIPNIWAESSKNTKESLTDGQIRQILKAAKHDASVILARHRTIENLPPGSDPRGGRGVRGKWGLLENRIWAVRNAISPKVATYDFLNKNFPGIVRPLESREAAPIIQHTGAVVNGRGILGHLRCLYPSGRELASIAILVMLRTSFNFSSVARLAVKDWHAPYPFSPPHNEKDAICYILSSKSRGKQEKGADDKVVHAFSLMAPWSHPYRLLAAAELMTANTRTALKAALEALKIIQMPSKRESLLIERYEEIKDHLFVFWSEGEFRSYIDEAGNPHHSFRDALEQYCGATSVNLLRSAGLTFAVVSPGGSHAILQLIGNHKRRMVTYERRRNNLKAAEEALKTLVEQSLILAESNEFTYANLRKKLAAQGFDRQQISNLLNPDNETAWGNRCADPANPPADFNRGAPPGELCSIQNCIDGCPNARWLPESLPFLKETIRRLQTEQESLGQEATFASSHKRRIVGVATLIKGLSETLRTGLN